MVRQEAGLSGTGPSAVTGQTGENKRIVDWVKSAWDEIQMYNPDWFWMRGSFSFSTIANDYDYTSSGAGITTRFANWDMGSIRLYQTSVDDEMSLPAILYQDYRTAFLTGLQTATRPVCCSVSPDNQLLLGDKPDGAYVVRGDYFKTPQALAADSDTPEMPEQYHMAIVWRALMKYARYDAAAEIYQDARENYRRIMIQLNNKQMPGIGHADPLA